MSTASLSETIACFRPLASMFPTLSGEWYVKGPNATCSPGRCVIWQQPRLGSAPQLVRQFKPQGKLSRPEAAATGSKGRHPKQMPWPSVQVPMAQGSRASAKFCKRSSSKVSPNTQRELPGKGRRSIPMVETWRHHLVASKNEQILSLTLYTCHSDICPLAYASFCKKSSSLRRGAALADMDS